MELSPYTNKQITRGIFAANMTAAGLIILSFALLFGFASPHIAPGALYVIQTLVVTVFFAEKITKAYIARSAKEYIRSHWFEFFLLVLLLIILFQSGKWENPAIIRQVAIGGYLVFQITGKMARLTVRIASRGKNPVLIMLGVFAVLIGLGCLFLMLPAAGAKGRIGFIDALFTATSAVTVTGLTVKSTSADISLFGQHIILFLIQFGGLSIIVFGVVLAFMAGQIFSVKQRELIGDVMSLDQFGHTGKVVTFILIVTAGIELAGAILLLDSWGNIVEDRYSKWFYSVFYSISAFCNAGFGLIDIGLVPMKSAPAIYLVICPLIILGGLGFGVLYNAGTTFKDMVVRGLKKLIYGERAVFASTGRRLQLQSKIVLVMTAVLIVVPVIAFLVFENNIQSQHDIAFTSVQEDLFGSAVKPQPRFGFLDSIFQSISARTAGFATVDIGSLSAPSLATLLVLMFIGGSPASTAGGIKTVTLAILVMAAYSSIRNRDQVEMFGRSVRLIAVGRALTITLLFCAMIILVSFCLSITERHNPFTFDQIIFETTSAVTTSGLSTGITPSLTTAGKLLIIITMLAGRLGPLILLAFLTLKVKPVRYSYPEEPVVVG